MTTTEMPKYKCHKEVWALKIKNVITERRPNGDSFLEPEDERYGQIKVDPEYMSKHKPHSGGYYVVYEDGYKSFSPAEAFESGYSLK